MQGASVDITEVWLRGGGSHGLYACKDSILITSWVMHTILEGEMSFFFVLWNSPFLEQVSITCLDDITLLWHHMISHDLIWSHMINMFSHVLLTSIFLQYTATLFRFLAPSPPWLCLQPNLSKPNQQYMHETGLDIICIQISISDHRGRMGCGHTRLELSS